MIAPSLDFFLVPDAGMARRARRLLAQERPCAGVQVGTWLELVERAGSACLLPPPASNDEPFRDALAAMHDAFWADSLAVAPDETSVAVRAAFVNVLSATDPCAAISVAGLAGLSERPRRHLHDLFRLHEHLAGYLPGELAAIQALLAVSACDALFGIRVWHTENRLPLTRWQAALVGKLNTDAGAAEPADDRRARLELLNERLAATSAVALPTGVTAGSLARLQADLFTPDAQQTALDDSVQWLAVRDFLHEAEVAAGMVQTLLAQGQDQYQALTPGDIGLVTPDSFEYATALEDTFAKAGLPLSGHLAERWRRDLGREAVFYFLYCRQRPAPVMALAVCLSSPLMPWSRKHGLVLAQRVMDGDFRLKPPSGSSHNDANVAAMLELLRGFDSEAGSLTEALRTFADLLSADADNFGHVQQAKAGVAQLQELLATTTSIDWTALQRTVNPAYIRTGETSNFNREGVTLWRESQQPWRPVRHLLVLGFAEGHYPHRLGSDAVFSADDLRAITDSTDLTVLTATEQLERRRQRLKRQLAAVTDSVRFLIPKRDTRGSHQAASTSLVFMHQLFTGSDGIDANERVLELATEQGRARARHIALAEVEQPQPPRELSSVDLHFERDLTTLRRDSAGKARPQSPSSLENLMVSSLAWLLRQMAVEPQVWAPDAMDVKVLGTLAHAVFETLFRPGVALPAEADLYRLVDEAYVQAASRAAPFLLSPGWRVERRHFVAETAKAARAWRDMLERQDAEVLACEAWLEGVWAGVPIHGQADLIAGLPDGQLLVVDYKRSRSDNRRQRMEKGYDSQASLYREMLASGGLKAGAQEALAQRLSAAVHTGVVYYMLNDQVALSDTTTLDAGAMAGWHVLGGDVSNQAMDCIAQRLGDVSRGEVRLNRTGDATFFNKTASVTPYALEDSPLIGLFTLPDDAQVTA